MYVEILTGRRVQLASGTITYGEEQVVEALLGKFFPLSSPESDSKQEETEEIVSQLFDAMEEKNTERLQEKLDDELVTNDDLSSQLQRLAIFILKHVPNEPSENEGAIDTAMRVILNLQQEVAAKDILNKVLKAEMDGRTESLLRVEGSVRRLLDMKDVLELVPPKQAEISALERIAC